MDNKKFFEQELDNKKSILSDILIRLLTNNEVWKDIHFGANKNKLYIDGAIEYKDTNEKELIEEILKGNN